MNDWSSSNHKKNFLKMRLVTLRKGFLHNVNLNKLRVIRDNIPIKTLIKQRQSRFLLRKLAKIFPREKLKIQKIPVNLVGKLRPYILKNLYKKGGSNNNNRTNIRIKKNNKLI